MSGGIRLKSIREICEVGNTLILCIFGIGSRYTFRSAGSDTVQIKCLFVTLVALSW